MTASNNTHSPGNERNKDRIRELYSKAQSPTAHDIPATASLNNNSGFVGLTRESVTGWIGLVAAAQTKTSDISSGITATPLNSAPARDCRSGAVGAPSPGCEGT